MCYWEGEEEDLYLVEFDNNDEEENPTSYETPSGFITTISESPEDRGFLKGCPECLTDSYLMDIENEQV